MVFHGLLVTLWITGFCLKICFVWFLKLFCKEAFVQANFVMILVRKNVYKVFDLLKMFSSFERCFRSVGVCFENSKDFFVLK